MIDNEFENTASMFHSSVVSDISSGNTYSFYVKCIDASGNISNDEAVINFSVENIDDNSINNEEPIENIDEDPVRGDESMYAVSGGCGLADNQNNSRLSFLLIFALLLVLGFKRKT